MDIKLYDRPAQISNSAHCMTSIQMTLTVELLMKAVTPPRQSVVCPGNNWNDFCVTTYSEQGCF